MVFEFVLLRIRKGIRQMKNTHEKQDTHMEMGNLWMGPSMDRNIGMVLEWLMILIFKFFVIIAIYSLIHSSSISIFRSLSPVSQYLSIQKI